MHEVLVLLCHRTCATVRDERLFVVKGKVSLWIKPRLLGGSDQLVHLAHVVISELIEGLEARAYGNCNVGGAERVHRLQFFFKVAQHVWLVVEFKDDDEDKHVDGEEQKNDKHELENDLRAQAHLCPASRTELLPCLSQLFLVLVFGCIRLHHYCKVLLHTSL